MQDVAAVHSHNEDAVVAYISTATAAMTHWTNRAVGTVQREVTHVERQIEAVAHPVETDER